MPRLTDNLDHPDRIVKLRTMEILQRNRSKAQMALPKLRALTTSEAEYIRNEAFMTIAAINPAEKAPPPQPRRPPGR